MSLISLPLNVHLSSQSHRIPIISYSKTNDAHSVTIQEESVFSSRYFHHFRNLAT